MILRISRFFVTKKMLQPAFLAVFLMSGFGAYGIRAASAAVYTDLTSAPVGAYVTVYGINSATSSWPIHSHGTNGNGVLYTIVQVPDAVTPLTVGGQSISVTVNDGRVIEATTADLASKFSVIQPGDVIYLHAGTYTGKYDTNGWNESNFVLFTSGTASLPMAVVAYPGESVTIDNTGVGGGGRPNFYLGDSGGGQKGSYFTIAGLNLIAEADTISGGGNTADSSTPESGADHVRVVGCTHTITDATSNTMTGLISIQGDAWKVLGNILYDPVSRTIINNNHGIYVQNGADDVEIAYNSLLNLRMGHTIQVHQDGTPMLYTNVWIHDNLIQGATATDIRGISVSNIDSTSTVTIENNTVQNAGQGFGAVTVYRGVVQVRNNTFENVDFGIQVNGNYGGTRTVTESGNTFTNAGSNFSAENGANLSDIVHEVSSDTTAPTVLSVSSDTANGSYNAGDVIDIDVTFSEAVTSTGSVTVTLETGTTDRTCTFTVSSSTTGTCNYTVQTGDTSSDLTVNSITGTVADAAANPMTSPATPTTNLAANKALVIDTTSSTPTVLYTDITSGPMTGGENNKGVWLSVFGMNFGSVPTDATVTVGGASTQTFKVFGTSRGRQDIQQITIQLGDLSGATLSNGTAYTVGVTVNGVAASNPNSLTFTPNPGNIWFISPTGNDTTGDGSFANPYLTAQNAAINTGDTSGQCLDSAADLDSFANAGAWKYMHRGDVMVFRGGTYTTVGKDNFFLRVFNRRGSPATGTAGTGPLTFMGYPGETPYIDRSLSSDYNGAPGGGFSSADSARQANGCGAYVTITNIKIESGRGEGPITTQAGYLNLFGSHWRVVNNEMSGATCSYNTLCKGGGVSGSGAGNFYFGNHIHDMDDKPDASTNDENHGFYLDGGGQTEIAFNWINDITHGNGMQTYSSSGTDITNVVFHHNIIDGTSKHCINVADGSTSGFVYYDNVAMNCGQSGLRFNTTGLSAMKFYNNTIFNISGTSAVANDWNLPVGSLDFRNNIVVPNNVTKYYSGGSVGWSGGGGVFSYNLWYNGTGSVLGTSNQTTNPLFVSTTSGSEDLNLQASSPAIDTGTSAVSATVTDDYRVIISRPQGSAYDIGAYEYVSSAPDTTAPGAPSGLVVN